MIVYLHGFNSSPQSHKAQVLKPLPGGQGARRTCTPARRCRTARGGDPRDRERGSRGLPARDLTFVGSSLGGYYATYLAEKHGLPRRADQPGDRRRTSASRAYLGTQKNLHTGEPYELTRGAPGEWRAPAGRARRPRALPAARGDRRRGARLPRRGAQYAGARRSWCATAATTRCRASPSTSPRILAFAGVRAVQRALTCTSCTRRTANSRSARCSRRRRPRSRSRARTAGAPRSRPPTCCCSFERPARRGAARAAREFARRPRHRFPLAVLRQGRRVRLRRISRASTSAASRRRRRAPACCSSCTRRRCTSTGAAAAASRRRPRKRSSSRSRAWRRRSACRSRSRTGRRASRASSARPRSRACATSCSTRPTATSPRPRRSSRPARRPGCPRPRLFERCGLLPDSHDYHLGRFLYEFYPRGDGFPPHDAVAAARRPAARRGRGVQPGRRRHHRDRRRVLGHARVGRRVAHRHPHRRAGARASRPARRSTRSRASACRPPTCRAASSPCCPRT